SSVASLDLHSPFSFPALAQSFGIENTSRPVAQILDFMLNARGNQPIGLCAWHAVCHLLEFFERKITANARTDLPVLENARSLRHRIVGAFQINWDYAHPGM